MKKIKNSKQALREHKNLESVWSRESELNQRILIYIAEMLEMLARELKPKSAYNLFVAEIIKRGGTMKEAARLWQAIKEQK